MNTTVKGIHGANTTSTDVADVDASIELTGVAPAELRRRLRHASVLLGAAEMTTIEQVMILRRARHHLSGTLRRLDDLIARVEAAPLPFDEQLTERHQSASIDPIP